jgi:tyrosine-protein kinase Etk/Wzc
MEDNLTSQAVPGDDDEISLLDLLQTVVENLRLLVLGPLAVGLTALGISFVITPTFTATTKFLPPQQQQSAAASMLASLGALGGLAGAATGIKNPLDQYVAFMKSNAIEDALIKRFDLMTRYEQKYLANTRKTLEGNSRISSGKDGMISVEVDDKDPKFAADLANAYVEELSHLTNGLALTEAQQRRKFFEQKLQEAKKNMVAAELALQSSGVPIATIKSDPKAAVTLVAELQARIVVQEVKIASMRGYLAETAPEFKQALTELAAIRAQLLKAEKSDQANGSAKDADYVARFRDFKYHETLFELFAKQYEIARVDESREGAVIQVIDKAVPPELKSKPKKALIAILATLASGFLLLLYVFVRQAMRNAAQTPETAEQMARLKASWARALGRR